MTNPASDLCIKQFIFEILCFVVMLPCTSFQDLLWRLTDIIQLLWTLRSSPSAMVFPLDHNGGLLSAKPYDLHTAILGPTSVHIQCSI